MPLININAHITVFEDGKDKGYYPVSLAFVPHIGDSIDLDSRIDRASGHPSKHYLRVDRVTHEIEDVEGKGPEKKGGSHFIQIEASKVPRPIK